MTLKMNHVIHVNPDYDKGWCEGLTPVSSHLKCIPVRIGTVKPK